MKKPFNPFALDGLSAADEHQLHLVLLANKISSRPSFINVVHGAKKNADISLDVIRHAHMDKGVIQFTLSTPGLIKPRLSATLDYLECYLPFPDFVRLNQSRIIKVSEIAIAAWGDMNVHTRHDEYFHFSRNYKDLLKEALRQHPVITLRAR